jgi:pimeloyl-ACP methyl ester carboxylesterase
MPKLKRQLRRDHAEAAVSIWKEALFGVELLLLHTAPVFYGLGVPHGDRSAVVLIPCFLGTDPHLAPLHHWLGRIGYRPYFSHIGVNAGCPNLLVRERLTPTINKALAATGRKVHLIGHSLGGVMARSIAARRPADIASVITLAAPFRGTVAHRSILCAAESVRRETLDQHGCRVLSDCYTSRCTCEFVSSLRHKLPATVAGTAIYTRADGVVDWRYCRTGDDGNDFEVPGTHVGLVYNPSVYTIIAQRLAQASASKKALSAARVRSQSRLE